MVCLLFLKAAAVTTARDVVRTCCDQNWLSGSVPGGLLLALRSGGAGLILPHAIAGLTSVLR
jgi:hypothetical protein